MAYFRVKDIFKHLSSHPNIIFSCGVDGCVAVYNKFPSLELIWLECVHQFIQIFCLNPLCLKILLCFHQQAMLYIIFYHRKAPLQSNYLKITLPLLKSQISLNFVPILVSKNQQNNFYLFFWRKAAGITFLSKLCKNYHLV